MKSLSAAVLVCACFLPAATRAVTPSSLTVNFTGINKAAVTSAGGENFLYQIGGVPAGTLNVRLLSGDLDSVTTGSSPDSTGFYAIQSSPNLAAATFRFTLDVTQTVVITENESLTSLEDNSFTMPSGTWDVLSVSQATVSNSGSTVDFHGTSTSPGGTAYSIRGSTNSFDFQIQNSAGFPSYGSAISLQVVPEPCSTLMLALPGLALFARRRSRRPSA